MDAGDCRNFSRHCVELANDAPDGEQSMLFDMAAEWLRIADKLEANPVFQRKMRTIEIFPIKNLAA
jgi:hypothetical protein